MRLLTFLSAVFVPLSLTGSIRDLEDFETRQISQLNLVRTLKKPPSEVAPSPSPDLLPVIGALNKYVSDQERRYFTARIARDARSVDKKRSSDDMTAMLDRRVDPDFARRLRQLATSTNKGSSTKKLPELNANSSPFQADIRQPELRVRLNNLEAKLQQLSEQVAEQKKALADGITKKDLEASFNNMTRAMGTIMEGLELLRAHQRKLASNTQLEAVITALKDAIDAQQLDLADQIGTRASKEQVEQKIGNLTTRLNKLNTQVNDLSKSLTDQIGQVRANVRDSEDILGGKLSNMQQSIQSSASDNERLAELLSKFAMVCP